MLRAKIMGSRLESCIMFFKISGYELALIKKMAQGGTSKVPERGGYTKLVAAVGGRV